MAHDVIVHLLPLARLLLYFEPTPLYDRLTSWSRSPGLLARVRHETEIESKFRSTIIRDAYSDTAELWFRVPQLQRGQKEALQTQQLDRHGVIALTEGARLTLNALLSQEVCVFVPWGWRKVTPPKVLMKSRKRAKNQRAIAHRYVDGGVVNALDAIQAFALRYRAHRFYSKHLEAIRLDSTLKSSCRLGAINRGVRASAISTEFAKEYIVQRKKLMADSTGITLANMALTKELQKTMMDSKNSADKDAKAAAALLKSTQLDAAMKAKSKVDAKEAADALRECSLYMQHAEYMNQITSEFHMPCYPDWTPPAGYAAKPAYSKPRLIMTIRLTDYFVRITNQENIAELKDQWATFSTWLRQLGFTVKLDHSAKQIGSSCGIVDARETLVLSLGSVNRVILLWIMTLTWLPFGITYIRQMQL